MNSDVNGRLKEIRSDLGYNQKEFAQQLGFRQSYYSEVENGKRPVTSRVVAQLVDIHNVSADWMFSGKGEKFLVPPTKKGGGFISKNEYDNLLKSESLGGGKMVGAEWGSDQTSGDGKNKSFTPYNFYKELNSKDLDFEISITIEEFKEVHEDYRKLIEFFTSLNAPDFLIEKFPSLPEFRNYRKSVEDEFNEDHAHLKDEKQLKILKIVDLYQAEIEHLRNQLSSLIDYLHRYADFFTDDKKNP